MPRLRLKWHWIMLLAIILMAGAYVAYRYLRSYQHEQQLAAILSELDQNEPGWDWEHRLERLPQSKPAENAGEEIKAINRLLAIDEYRNTLGRNAWGNEHERIHNSKAFQAYADYLVDHPQVRYPADFRQVLEALLATSPGPEALNRACRLHQF